MSNVNSPWAEFGDGPQPQPNSPRSGADKPRREGWRGALDVNKELMARIRRVEGKRGMAARAAIIKQQAISLMTVLGCVAITTACFAGTQWSGGGLLLLVSATIMSVTASIASIVFPERRYHIVIQFAEVFWPAMWSATGLAIIDRVLRGFLANPANSDTIFNTVSSTMPILFAATALIPPVLLVKTVASFRNENRSHEDVEEEMRRFTRQDGYMR